MLNVTVKTVNADL